MSEEFDRWLDRELARGFEEVRAQAGPPLPRYRLAAAAGGGSRPGFLRARARVPQLVSGIAAAAVLMSGGVVAAAAASGSPDPQVWGQHVRAAVVRCTTDTAPGESGLGACMSALAAPQTHPAPAAATTPAVTPTDAEQETDADKHRAAASPTVVLPGAVPTVVTQARHPAGTPTPDERAARDGKSHGKSDEAGPHLTPDASSVAGAPTQAADRADETHGSVVREVAHTAPTGEAHGDAVSAAAHANKPTDIPTATSGEAKPHGRDVPDAAPTSATTAPEVQPSADTESHGDRAANAASPSDRSQGANDSGAARATATAAVTAVAPSASSQDAGSAHRGGGRH